MYCRLCGAKISDDSQYCESCGFKVKKIDKSKYLRNVLTSESYRSISNLGFENGGGEENDLYDETEVITRLDTDLLDKFYVEKAAAQDKKEKQMKKKRKFTIAYICLAIAFFGMFVFGVLKVFVFKSIDYSLINRQLYNANINTSQLFYYEDKTVVFDKESTLITCYSLKEGKYFEFDLSACYDEILDTGIVSCKGDNIYVSFLIEEDSYCNNRKIIAINTQKDEYKEISDYSIKKECECSMDLLLHYYLDDNGVVFFEGNDEEYKIIRTKKSGVRLSLNTMDGNKIPSWDNYELLTITEDEKGIVCINTQKENIKKDIVRGLVISKNDKDTQMVSGINRVYRNNKVYYVINSQGDIYTFENSDGEWVTEKVEYARDMMSEIDIGDEKYIFLDESHYSIDDNPEDVQIKLLPRVLFDEKNAYIEIVINYSEGYNQVGVVEIGDKQLQSLCFPDTIMQNEFDDRDYNIILKNGCVELFSSGKKLSVQMEKHYMPYTIPQAQESYSELFESYMNEDISEEDYLNKISASRDSDPFGYVVYSDKTYGKKMAELELLYDGKDYLTAYQKAEELLNSINSNTERYSAVKETMNKSYEAGLSYYPSILEGYYNSNMVEEYESLGDQLVEVYGEDEDSVDYFKGVISDFSTVYLVSRVYFGDDEMNIQYNYDDSSINGCASIVDFGEPGMEYCYGIYYYLSPVFRDYIMPMNLNIVNEGDYGYSFEYEDNLIVACHQKEYPNNMTAGDESWKNLDFRYEYNERGLISGVVSTTGNGLNYYFDYDDSGKVIRETYPSCYLDEDGNMISYEKTRLFIYNESGYISSWTEGSDEELQRIEIQNNNMGKPEIVNYYYTNDNSGLIKQYTYKYNEKGLCTEIHEENELDGTDRYIRYEYNPFEVNTNIDADIFG